MGLEEELKCQKNKVVQHGSKHGAYSPQKSLSNEAEMDVPPMKCKQDQSPIYRGAWLGPSSITKDVARNAERSRGYCS